MNTTAATLSRRAERRFWGWGELSTTLTAGERSRVGLMLAWLGGGGPALPEPALTEFELPPPRVLPPPSLATVFSSSAYDRLTHCGGKSFPDLARSWSRNARPAPDWVAFPADEHQVAAVLDWAAERQVAVVPFGGGTSVVGGVEPVDDERFAGCVVLDLERLDRVLEVDATSRAARIQAGVLGLALEQQLRPHGLTLRHYPQSFEFSTLGGWIATRAGGHYATLTTHIDDFIQSTRMLTPAGAVQTRRLPASGAGPAPDRLVLGSEGVFGVITEAWMRLQERPRFRASTSVRFGSMAAAVAGVRALAQSGLNPANCRLLDPAEVAFAGVGDRRSATLVLGLESADHDVAPAFARALELLGDHGGSWDPAPDGAGPHRLGDSGAWRDAFLRMPYLRDEAVRRGAILDTFESAVTWDGFEAFYDGVLSDVRAAITRITGREPLMSCRLTHVYPDGAAVYVTYAAAGSDDGDLTGAVAKWREIKAACNEAVIAHGGTSTHHHAVGRDHRSAYQAEVPALLRGALAAAKSTFDPAGIMNPGVLL